MLVRLFARSYISDADGTNAYQVVRNGMPGTSFAPFFLPDDSGLIFSSNLGNPNGGEFHLYVGRSLGAALG